MRFPRRHPFLLYIRIILAGLCGLIVGCVVLRSVRVVPGHLALRLRHLAMHPEYDTLFLGPSYTMRQIDPRRFDEQLAGRGIHRKSMNIAASNWGVTELDQVLDAVMKLPLKNMKTVFIDVTLSVGREQEQNLGNLESISFQTPWNFLRELYYLQFPHGSRRELLTQIKLRGLNTMANALNVGQGSLYAGQAFLTPAAAVSINEFRPQPSDYDFQHNSPNFENEYTYMLEMKRKEVPQRQCKWSAPHAKFRRPYLLKWRETLAKRNIQLVFIVAPVVFPTLCITTWPDGSPLEILQLDDPTREAKLYRREYRYNHNHLNSKGAEIYSDLIAQYAVPFLTEKGKP